MNIYDRFHAKILQINGTGRLSISKEEFDHYWEILGQSSRDDIPLFVFKSPQGTQCFQGFGVAKKQYERPTQVGQEIWIGIENFFQNKQRRERKDQYWNSILPSDYHYILPLFGLFAFEDHFYLFSNIEKVKGFNIDTFLKFFNQNETATTQVRPIRKNLQKPTQKEWNACIQKALEQLNQESQELKKVVIARQSTLKTSPESALANIKTLFDSFYNHYLFYFRPIKDQAFISLSPEKLLEIKNGTLYIDAIAGTRMRSNDLNKDFELEKELLDSQKELEEHRHVKKSIERKLKGIGQVECVKNEEILKLTHVQHIHSQYEVHFAQEGIHLTKINELIDLIHPTPAVGGTPKEASLDFIDGQESFERGAYAAPVGIMAREVTHFIVAIRSALITKDQSLIFAGAGIVKDSISEQEWRETEDKMQTIKDIFQENTKQQNNLSDYTIRHKYNGEEASPSNK